MSKFDVFSLNFFNYKKPFFGSYKGMRYCIYKKITENEEDGSKKEELGGYHWRGPFASDKVAEEEKTYRFFSFDEMGREDLLAWLEEEYEAKYRKEIIHGK